MVLVGSSLDGLPFAEPNRLLTGLKPCIVNFLMLEIKLPSIAIRPYHFILFYSVGSVSLSFIFVLNFIILI